MRVQQREVYVCVSVCVSGRARLEPVPLQSLLCGGGTWLRGVTDTHTHTNTHTQSAADESLTHDCRTVMILSSSTPKQLYSTYS